jgi:hypothetical protein
MHKREQDSDRNLWAPCAADELTGLKLGDRRLENRAVRMVAAMAQAPDKSLPRAVADDAELQGAYGLIGNKRVTADKLLAPHVARTVERVGLCDEVVVATPASLSTVARASVRAWGVCAATSTKAFWAT